MQQEKEALRSELSARIDMADESLQDVRELCIASQDLGLRAKLQDEVASAKRTADAAFSRADNLSRTIAEVSTVWCQERRIQLALSERTSVGRPIIGLGGLTSCPKGGQMRPLAGQNSHTEPIAEALCFATTQASSHMRGVLGPETRSAPSWASARDASANCWTFAACCGLHNRCFG